MISHTRKSANTNYKGKSFVLPKRAEKVLQLQGSVPFTSLEGESGDLHAYEMRWHPLMFKGDCFKAASKILLVMFLDAIAFGVFKDSGVSACIAEICTLNKCVVSHDLILQKD